MNFKNSVYKNKNVLVTGATGLIGSHIVSNLLKKSANVRITIHENPNFFGDSVEAITGDLKNYDFCEKAVAGMDYVFHCAAFSGGLGLQLNRPLDTFFPNLIMNTNLLEASLRKNVDRFEFTSNNSVYPTSDDSMIEERGTEGVPFPIGYASIKRMGELQSKLFHDNSEMKVAITRGGNAYGEYDNFDLDTSHVVPALIRKVVEKHNPLIVWGDGTQIRDYIYAEDLAEGILLALENYANGEPINIGTGKTTTTKELIETICDICDYKDVEIIFDETKLVGQKIKLIDITKCRNKLGFNAKTSLRDGLEKSINWFKQDVGNE